MHRTIEISQSDRPQVTQPVRVGQPITGCLGQSYAAGRREFLQPGSDIDDSAIDVVIRRVHLAIGDRDAECYRRQRREIRHARGALHCFRPGECIDCSAKLGNHSIAGGFQQHASMGPRQRPQRAIEQRHPARIGELAFGTHQNGVSNDVGERDGSRQQLAGCAGKWFDGRIAAFYHQSLSAAMKFFREWIV